MNWEQIQGKWQQCKGQVKQRWSKLTDWDITVINGKRDVLAGKLCERNGMTKELVEKEIAEFERACQKAEEPASGLAGFK